MANMKSKSNWYWLLGRLSAFILFIASISVVAACDGPYYQPIVPAQLREEEEE